MLSALAVLLLVHIERLNLHGPSDVGQYVARGWGKGPSEVVGKWVQRRRSWCWRTPRSRGHLPSTLPLATREPICHPGAKSPPWSWSAACIFLFIFLMVWRSISHCRGPNWIPSWGAEICYMRGMNKKNELKVYSFWPLDIIYCFEVQFMYILIYD